MRSGKRRLRAPESRKVPLDNQLKGTEHMEDEMNIYDKVTEVQHAEDAGMLSEESYSKIERLLDEAYEIAYQDFLVSVSERGFVRVDEDAIVWPDAIPSEESEGFGKEYWLSPEAAALQAEWRAEELALEVSVTSKLRAHGIPDASIASISKTLFQKIHWSQAKEPDSDGYYRAEMTPDEAVAWALRTLAVAA